MTMQRSLTALRSALEEIHDAVRELAISIDDWPESSDDPAIVDALRGSAADVEGDTAETQSSLAGVAESEESGDAVRAVRRLAEAHERYHTLQHRVRFSLARHENLFEVDRIARARDAAWRGWSSVVLRQFERIDDALDRGAAAFIACWQEIAERAVLAVTVSHSPR
jgi:hypothetical protein